MRFLFAGHKARGVACLRALLDAGHTIVGVLAHPTVGGSEAESVARAARESGLDLQQPADVHDPLILERFRRWAPDAIVLAGFAPIVRREFFELAPLGCLNLHGGKLPQYRGSSPMNWALMNGEREITLSIIRVDEGVDTGDVLAERVLPIGIDDTIADVQRIANQQFPSMLVDVAARLEKGTIEGRKQDESQAAYHPLRFPDDGLILWDQLTAVQIHNRIRALTDPYPGAFTFFRGCRVTLLGSRLAKRTQLGEPGRVYVKNDNGLLVCASDRCLWIRRAVMDESGDDALARISRYDRLATVREAAAAVLARQS